MADASEVKNFIKEQNQLPRIILDSIVVSLQVLGSFQLGEFVLWVTIKTSPKEQRGAIVLSKAEQVRLSLYLVVWLVFLSVSHVAAKNTGGLSGWRRQRFVVWFWPFGTFRALHFQREGSGSSRMAMPFCFSYVNFHQFFLVERQNSFFTIWN